jgi:hypothetical protein
LGKDSINLDLVIGNKFEANPYNLLGKDITIIPLPHPSGASTWVYQKKNRLLLDQALNLLKTELFENFK